MKKTNELRERQQKIKRDHRKLEAQLVEQGKTPYYLKPADLKKLELAEEFESYKSRSKNGDGDLNKFLEKKRKRKASKQKKFMPRPSRE